MRFRSFAGAVALVWAWIVVGPAAERRARRVWYRWRERPRSPSDRWWMRHRPGW